MPALQFWFDFASTYSYLSAMRIDKLAGKAGVDVSWKPFLLGPIFADNGWDTSPFNLFPARGRYMWRDMERITKERGVPLNRPETFPQFTLTAARTGVAAAGEPWLPGFCRALFEAEYGRGEDITCDDATARALERSGTEPQEWLDKARQPGTKQALKDRVDEARSLGIFGAPTFITSDGELFWGDDRLEAAIAWAADSQPG
ncbi:MAG: 2-hydroxychromene-2-carboxylate isomerase [Rhizobiales bacterium]|nr:2-hydroxychromene-2-carboxylate isomerase [Hyphomicrobiales bacterium]